MSTESELVKGKRVDVRLIALLEVLTKAHDLLRDIPRDHESVQNTPCAPAEISLGRVDPAIQSKQDGLHSKLKLLRLQARTETEP